jgi:hypothetical protein
MPACPCRSPRSGEATREVENVAPRDVGLRHARLFMSPRTMATGDMLWLPCRSWRAGGATWSSRDVAPHRCVRRHFRAGLSPLPSSSSDMQGRERRAWRGSGATCPPRYVAPHPCKRRHRSDYRVARPLEPCDIRPLAFVSGGRAPSPYTLPHVLARRCYIQLPPFTLISCPVT